MNKRSYYRQTFLLFFLCLKSISSFTQVSNSYIELSRSTFKTAQVISPSPEAAELGKYGNIPVSLFTGTPDISVPLVTLRGKVLSLPTSLSYNSHGFRPEDIAPWTGLSWSLNAGGVITRSVLGEPDLEDNYYITHSPLNPVPTDELAKQQYFLGIRDKQKETQPDAYYFNFMGRAGCFYIKPDGSIFKKENDLLNIVLWPGVDENHFIITDENGIRYEFAEIEKTTISPIDDQPNAPPLIVKTFVSSWYISRVIAPYGNEEITFTYHAPVSGQPTLSNALANKSVTYSKVNDHSSFWEGRPVQGTATYFHPPVVVITRKFPDKVIFKKENKQVGYIEFESSINERIDLSDADFDGERRLNKVSLYHTQNSTSALVKQFELKYEYFGSAQTEPQGFRRLKLKTVQELSPNPATLPSKPPYTFHYNNEHNTMPARYTSSLDHWGFYNGKSNTYGSQPTLVPNVFTTAQYVSGNRGEGADREPNSEAASYTVLNKIDFPTGGYTIFEYEGNVASSWGSNIGNTPVGGVRIKQITDFSFPDKPALIKNYRYTTADGQTSGRYHANINYATPSVHTVTGECFGPNMNPITYSVTISAASTFGLGTIQGSHVGYETVTEYLSASSGSTTAGKTVYTYDVVRFSPVDSDIGNGSLLKKQVFDNGGKLLQEIVNEYSYVNKEMLINRKLYTAPEQSDRVYLYRNASNEYLYFVQSGCHAPPAGYNPVLKVPAQFFPLEDHIFKQNKRLSKETLKVFNETDSTYLTSYKIFTYGNPQHNYPTLIEEIDSKGEKLFTDIKYVMDYTIDCSPQSGSMASKLSQMKANNMMVLPVEKLQYRQTASGGSRRYINGEYIEYSYGLPEKYYFLETHVPLSAVTPSEASCTVGTPSIAPSYRLAATIDYYSNYNIKEEAKTNDVSTTYFWGYKGLYPVAKVIGKTHVEALTTGIVQEALDNPQSETALSNELNKLRVLPNALVTTYTYNPSGTIASVKDESGRQTSFIYDMLNRLTATKDENGNITHHTGYNYGLGTAPTSSPVTLWYNAVHEQTYTKQGCPAGQFGEQVLYTVPYSKYASSISQADADNKASADLAANGQAFANNTGSCGWLNAAINNRVFKNDCTPDQGLGGFIWYAVPAGKYFSTISQADADALAMNEVNTVGQQQANEEAQCTCIAENQKMVNGICETSNTKWWLGSDPNPGGGYICYYKYKFSDGSLSSNTYSENHSSACPQNP